MRANLDVSLMSSGRPVTTYTANVCLNEMEPPLFDGNLTVLCATLALASTTA